MRTRERLSAGFATAGFAAALGLAAILATPAAAEIKAPEDPIAKAAFGVLEKHCARCHQEGKLSAREKPAKNFGFILKLDELAANPNYILPGNPHGSKLFKQIVDKEMPYDVIYEGSSNPDVSESDLKALESWITSLGTKTAAACDARTFVGNKSLVTLIAADLEKQTPARAKGTRYLTLTHLKNACIDDEAMKIYRQGIIKLVNSLSRSSTIVRLETADEEQTIVRINIDDLGWDARDWDSVLAVYPYNTQPETQLSAALRQATGTRMPYVRADWFAYTAARPGLYDTLLKLPKTFQALAREQGVDVDGNIRKFLAQRAGFQKSGVSRNNRLIERHPSRSGYFWTSYDFAGNKGKQSLFEHPLGPTGANAFQHDGGETIFSLPNGFQAYYLNVAKGDAISTGPTNIVQDPSSKDLAVTNGISCMGCHDQGMRKAKDDIRDHVLTGRAFPKDVRDSVEAIYPPREKMDRVIDDDARRFSDAMIRAGLEPALKLNGVEMINALAKRYEGDVDLTLAAAEFGLKKDDFSKVAEDASRKNRPLIRRIEQGSIPRDQFETTFVELSREITDDEVVNFGGGAKPQVAKVTGNADLSLTSDRNAYRQGDSALFTVVASKSCYLTLTNVDDKGKGTVIFPNRFQPDNLIKGRTPVLIPGASAPFAFKLNDIGTESVIAVCSDGKGEVDGIKHNFSREAFTEVKDYTRSIVRARQISVVGAKSSTPAGASKPAAAGGGATFRAAITIGVR